MTAGTPVERVKDLLSKAGYRPLSMPLTIGSVPFDFAGALVGPDRALDLVLIIDTIDENEGRVRQKITGLSRALDVIGSRRPLTAILTGPRPLTATVEALGRVCRVLSVGTPIGALADTLLRDALAVLLPLQLPEPTDSVADPMGELDREESNIDSDIKQAIISQASQGSDAVEEALRAILTKVLSAEPEGL